MNITVNMTAEEFENYQLWKKQMEQVPLVKFIYLDRFGRNVKPSIILFENAEFSEELRKLEAMYGETNKELLRSYEKAVNSGIEKSRKIEVLERDIKQLKDLQPKSKKSFWE